MSSIKIIAIDIDGTLVNDQQAINPATLMALQHVIASNIKVVLCTGRPPSGFQRYLDQLGINHAPDQYVICYNGALTQTTAGHIITSHQLALDDFFDLEALARQHGAHAYLCSPAYLYTVRKDVSSVAIKESEKVPAVTILFP